MRCSRLLLAAVLTLLALPSAAAHAALPGLNIGTTADGIVRPHNVDEVADTGARSIRIFVEWSRFEQAGDDRYAHDRVSVLKASVTRARERGMTPVLAVFQTPGWANGHRPANHPPHRNAEYAEFIAFLAKQLRGTAPVLEIWSEMDAGHFWHGAPEPVRYADMLARSKSATEGTDATVLFGALTGNNYRFFEDVYDQGKLTPRSFDGVALHTDTACQSNPPSHYVRNVGQGLDGRINQFSFLGFREVRASMVRRGLADHEIWMTELGWSTYQGGCEVAPGRPGGVTPDQQAAFIREAFECLANYDYVAHAQVFDLHDRGTARPDMFGIAGKPAFAVFRALAAAPPPPGIPCGDFTGPTVTVQSPTPGMLYNGPLKIAARATDPSGVTQFSVKVDGSEVRKVAADSRPSGAFSIDWFGAKDLPFGKHQLTVEALDAPSNVGVSAPVTIELINPATFGKKLVTRAGIRSATVRKGVATVGATIEKRDQLRLVGHLQAIFEVAPKTKPRTASGAGATRRRKPRWRAAHRLTRYVSMEAEQRSRTVRFRQRLKRGRRYRVRIVFRSRAPHKSFVTAPRPLKR